MQILPRYGAATWRTRRNIPYILVIFDSDLFLPLPVYENTTVVIDKTGITLINLFIHISLITITCHNAWLVTNAVHLT